MLKKQNYNKKKFINLIDSTIAKKICKNWLSTYSIANDNEKNLHHIQMKFIFFSNMLDQFFFRKFYYKRFNVKTSFRYFWREKITKNDLNSWNNDLLSKKFEKLSILKKQNWSSMTSFSFFSINNIDFTFILTK